MSAPLQSPGLVAVATAGMFLACTTAPRVPRTAISPRAPIAGTYLVRFCRAPCTAGSADHATVTGQLVLTTPSIDLRSVPEPQRSTLARLLAAVSRDTLANACFVLHRASDSSSPAGALPVGFTQWEAVAPDSIRFLLYRSPDSGYDVRLRMTATTGTGGGFLWWAVNGEHVELRDRVTVRRSGRARPNLCLDAARRRQ